MLSRRILRIKAFKAMYSYAENPAMTLKETEALFECSCEATRDLYLYMLSIIGPLTAEASARIEAAKSKFNPTPEELNPNMKFVNNGIAPLLEEDPDFQKIIKRKKFSWDQCDVLIRHLYETVRERDYFKAYMADPEQSLKQDADLWVSIFENEFEDNTELADILEDMSIYWNDDLAYSLSWCIRSLQALGKVRRWNLPELYMSDMLTGAPKKESDREFILGVIRTAYVNFKKYYDAVAERTPKWDKNRICATDLALIVCGLAEAEKFPGIGYKTTINEYVEISKFYSTPESRAFVNGLLDKLINKTTI